VVDSDRRALWLRGVLELCVLAALRDGERYGYELAQVLARSGLGEIKGGTLYPVLARLADSGLVTAEWRPGAGGPARKYYVLTPAGAELLALESAQWRSFHDAVRAILDTRGGPA
jgi:PadR family transcriptional regulator PadR